MVNELHKSRKAKMSFPGGNFKYIELLEITFDVRSPKFVHIISDTSCHGLRCFQGMLRSTNVKQNV